MVMDLHKLPQLEEEEILTDMGHPKLQQLVEEILMAMGLHKLPQLEEGEEEILTDMDLLKLQQLEEEILMVMDPLKPRLLVEEIPIWANMDHHQYH